MLIICGVLVFACSVFAGEIHDVARLGNIDSVKILLAGNPELIRSHNETGASPLHAATYNGQTAVAEYLLSAGADINAPSSSGSTPLHGAAFYGHLETVRLLISRGANLNVANKAGFVPLLSAAAAGHIEIVQALIEVGADTSARTTDGQLNAFQLAAFNGHLGLAEYLITKGFDINQVSLTCENFLHVAVNSDSIRIVKFGLDHGINPNSPNNSGETPLHQAIMSIYQQGLTPQKAEIIKLLMASGANINYRDSWGETPFSRAVMTRSSEAVSLLIGAGANIDNINKDGITPLLTAVRGGNQDIVLMLLQKGANTETQENRFGISPLHQAVLIGNIEIVRALLDHVKDINIKDSTGLTPFNQAIMTQNGEVVSLLIGAGADVNNINNDGATPLLTAVRDGNADIMRMLLQKGANTEIKENHYGISPLHQAVLSGNIETCRELIDHIKNINIQDNAGRTPLDLARQYGHKQIAGVLETKGGKENRIDKESNNLSSLKNPPDEGKADLWYLGHCGWAIRTQNHLMIFDYFPGSAQPTDISLSNGHINPDEIKDLNVEVFITHNHTDHYNPIIYDWMPIIKNITYIFGFKPEELPADQRQGFVGQTYTYIGPREIINIDGMQISTIKSNDGGVGFLVETDGLKIFHAGDHAGWENGDSLPYTSEIDYLATLTNKVDMAFINTTGCRFSRDTLALQQSVFYAIDKLSPSVTIPTHGFDREYVYREYAEKIKAKGYKTNVLCADFRGDHFKFKKED
jgi:ankyrin repeat protein